MEKITLKEIIKILEKKYGVGTVIKMNKDKINKDIEVISTRSVSLDDAIGGGIPVGRIIEVYGPESCLDENSYIEFNGINSKNEKVTHHKIKIKKLYYEFNNINSIDGRVNRWKDKSTITNYSVPSIDENNSVFQNRVVDVIHAGKKKCFRIITKRGASIETTAEHKFYNGKKYRKMSDLKVGDIVYLHENTRKKAEVKKNNKLKYEYFKVKYHPFKKREKKVSKYKYEWYKIKRSNATIEAKQNNMYLSEYINFLNSADKEKINKLWFIPKDFVCHHIDHNTLNDNISNLVLLSKQDHSKIHAAENQQYMNFIVTPDIIIKKEEVGYKNTYDIKCMSPYNNYIANKFVVHNSGKTTLCLTIIAEAQKAGKQCAYIDAEHSLDTKYAENIGVDVSKMYLCQPEYGEQALDVLENLVKTSEIGVIVVDSVAALTPKAEIDGEMGKMQIGLQARLMSQAMRKLAAITHKTNSTILFINQIRMKIGQSYGNPETTPGGSALKYYSSVRIEIRRAAKLSKDFGDGEEAVGNRTKVKIVKNKVAAPFKTTEIDIFFNKGISLENDVINFGLKRKILQKEGNSIFFKKEKLGRSVEATRLFLENNKEKLEEILKDIKTKKVVNEEKVEEES